VKKNYKAPEAEKIALVREPVTAERNTLSNIFPLVDGDDLPTAKDL